MTMRSAILLFLVAMAAIAGSGCSRTLVASLPVGTTTTCDAAWPGRWEGIDLKAKKDAGDRFYLEINADCSVLTSIDEHGKRERETHKLTLITTRSGQYLRYADGDGKAECIGEGDAHCGSELMRYVRSGNEIHLFAMDHAKVHEALASHAIDGYTDDGTAPAAATAGAVATETTTKEAADSVTPAKAANPTFNSWIAGDPEQIAAILEQHPEFFAADPMVLHRLASRKRNLHR